jgi:hypothetical protein
VSHTSLHDNQQVCMYTRNVYIPKGRSHGGRPGEEDLSTQLQIYHRRTQEVTSPREVCEK